ncbi:cobalamin biosynthesis protein CbiX [Rhodobacteraceae bacterium LMO-12]|nr:cobalamin biosynthesis protein CbiX [Rhodobacteraceae bacterium LMO-JJ12]
MPQSPQSFPNTSDAAPVAIIVAHGSPSDPAPHERVMQGLATKVAHHLPGWRIEGTTLANPGAFEAALGRVENPLIYPFFMARGWFTETHLIKRIGDHPAHVLPPTGVDPALPDLFADILRAVLAQRDWDAGDTTLLLAAHGSKSLRPASSESALVTAKLLGHVLGFRRTVTGFIEQPPYLGETARDLGQAICLPFFAMKAGHVLTDLPQALAEAKFDGPVLPVLAQASGLPALIANSLRRHATERHAA